MAKNFRSASTLNKILGIAKGISYISAIHYNHVMEQVAKSSHTKLLLCEHINGETKNCVLCVERCNICFGASPDLLASCSCCWEGAMEIKCPYICKDVSPFIVPPSFLQVVNVAIKHKPADPYYAQVPRQMSFTGRKSLRLFCFFQKKDIFHEFHLISRIGFC